MSLGKHSCDVFGAELIALREALRGTSDVSVAALVALASICLPMDGTRHHETLPPPHFQVTFAEASLDDFRHLSGRSG